MRIFTASTTLKMTALSVILTLATTATATPKVSGKDFLNRAIKYDTNNIKAYGRIVTGVVNYSSENADNNIIKTVDKHMLFCGSGELYEYEAESSEHSTDGAWYKTTRRFDSKDSATTVSTDKTQQSWLKFTGLSGFYQELQSKCTNANNKFPRIDIPITRSESTAFHAILDTFSNDGKLRHIWIKEQKIYKTEMREANGQPLVLSGETMYEYKFTEPRNYSMSRYAIDCKNEKLAVYQLIEYKAKGEVLKSELVDLNRLRLDAVIPNSIGEGIQKFVCSL